MKTVKRKIPATMVSQHPDHAGAPYWLDEPFIKTSHESKECFLSFSDLNVDEYKWDWEGKLVDESVIERLLSEYFTFFSQYPLGKKKFLTFRLPNPRIESEFRLGRAFMGILSGSALAKKFQFKESPIFEVILPMTETAEEMIEIQEAFREIANLKHDLFRFGEDTIKHIEVIPLFEDVQIIINSSSIIETYIKLHEKKFRIKPAYLRPYIARSDPALNSGLIPTILAVKLALASYQKLSKKLGIPLFPIIGTGSLPFRGSLRPGNIEQFVEEYAGVQTALIQSAFRYDYPASAVHEAIAYLHTNLPKGKAADVSEREVKQINQLIQCFEKPYKTTIEKIAVTINKIASHIPKRRERVQHVGLFGYSRGVGSVKLPRAISFTGSLYSLGIPPELIGTGRGLRAAKMAKLIPTLEKFYIHLKQDLMFAGGFVNKKNIQLLAKENPIWKEVLEDITEVEVYLGMELGPKTEEEKKHYRLTTKLFKQLESQDSLQSYIEKSAVYRKSIG